MSQAAYDPELLPIGVMGRPHGLRGEIVLRLHNPGGTDLSRAVELILEKGGVRDTRRLQSIRRVADGWLVKMVGAESRTDAEPLTNSQVLVRRATLPRLTDGEFFVADTVGCEVRTEDDRLLGVVADLFWNGAQDVMIVRGEAELLIPLIGEFIRSVDVAARRIVVAWTEADE
ncbi:MAG TPA: ribosome maturation factor RimM [Polyangia bacterium]